MPYKDKARQRDYSRQWIAKRRATWFENKSCVQCGSTERLELDHVDPSTKVDHCIWSWSEERRNFEIAKCQVLCYDCHRRKSNAFLSETTAHRPHPHRKLTNEQVLEIRMRKDEGPRKLGQEFGVSHPTISRLLSGIRYVKPLSSLGD